MLKLITPSLQNTFRRFPVSSCLAVAMFFYVVVGHVNLSEDKILKSLLCGFFGFGIAAVASEVRGWKWPVEMTLAAGLSLAGIALLWNDMFNFGGAVYWGGILLLLGVTPYLLRRSDDFSFWMYNKTLWSAVLFSAVAAGLIVGGIVIALVCIQFLFDVRVRAETFSHVVAFGVLLYAPVKVLSSFPTVYDVREEECPNSKGIFFLLNWVLVPLAAIYFLILYAYGIKVIALWEMPQGQVAYMVAGFGGLGIVTYLVGWPLREQSHSLARFLYKHFFALLLPPTALLFLAIYMRIADYGVTEPRYLIVLMAAWFTFLGVLFTVRPHTPIKAIVISLMVLLLAASCGPWGVMRLSESSQIKRLEKVLARNNMLENGVAVPRTAPLSFEDEKAISNSLRYLNRRVPGERTKALLPVMRQRNHNLAALSESLNIKMIPSYAKVPVTAEGVSYRIISFNAVNDNDVDVAGYDSLHRHLRLHKPSDGRGEGVDYLDHALAARRNQPKPDAPHVQLKDNEVFYNTPGQAPRKLDVASALMTLPALDQSHHRDIRQKPLVVESKDRKVRFLITSANFWVFEGQKYEIQSLSGDLLIRGTP